MAAAFTCLVLESWSSYSTGTKYYISAVFFLNMILHRYASPSRLLTCHVEDAITGVDVRQEGISQALASMCTFHQARNVNNVKESRDFAAVKEEEEKKGGKVRYARWKCASVQYNSM